MITTHVRLILNVIPVCFSLLHLLRSTSNSTVQWLILPFPLHLVFKRIFNQVINVYVLSFWCTIEKSLSVNRSHLFSIPWCFHRLALRKVIKILKHVPSWVFSNLMLDSKLHLRVPRATAVFMHYWIMFVLHVCLQFPLLLLVGLDFVIKGFIVESEAF